jgi:hypothetical protein
MILFLDFDGVLHPAKKNGEPVFCRLPLLWNILRACPNVQVVFSTTWREDFSFEYILDCVTSGGGEDLAHRFISTTPNLESAGHYGRRELEIQEWRNDNAHHGRWLAIDDMAELFSRHPNLYLVDGDTGLTGADVEKIIALTRGRSAK